MRIFYFFNIFAHVTHVFDVLYFFFMMHVPVLFPIFSARVTKWLFWYEYRAPDHVTLVYFGYDEVHILAPNTPCFLFLHTF